MTEAKPKRVRKPRVSKEERGKALLEEARIDALVERARTEHKLARELVGLGQHETALDHSIAAMLATARLAGLHGNALLEELANAVNDSEAK